MARKKHNRAKTAVSYYRISSANQNVGENLLRRKAIVREKARELGAEIVEEFEDVGVPSDTDKQTGLQKLIRYLAENRVDYVITPSFSMLSRNFPEAVEHADKIEQSGAKLLSASGEKI